VPFPTHEQTREAAEAGNTEAIEMCRSQSPRSSRNRTSLVSGTRLAGSRGQKEARRALWVRFGLKADEALLALLTPCRHSDNSWKEAAVHVGPQCGPRSYSSVDEDQHLHQRMMNPPSTEMNWPVT